MGDEIDELLDEVTIDAYGEDEQLWAFRQAFEEEGRFPFAGRVVATDVQVESIDYAGEERRGRPEDAQSVAGPVIIVLIAG